MSAGSTGPVGSPPAGPVLLSEQGRESLRTPMGKNKTVKTKQKGVWKAYAACVIAHGFWGLSFLASRRALEVAPVFVLLSHRFLIALLLMSIPAIRLVRFRGKGRQMPLLLLMGLAEPVIYFFGEQFGLLHSNTIFSGLMIAIIQVVSTLLAIPALGERVTRGQLLFSLISVCGVVGIGMLQRNVGALDWIGVLWLIVAVLSAAAHILLNRGISRDFSAFERTYMMMVLGAVVFTTLAWIRCRGELSAYLRPLRDGTYLTAMLFLSVCCSATAHFLSGYSLGRLSVARKAVFSNLTTAVSVFAGVVFLHEPFSWLSLLLCLPILGGIYGVQRTALREEKTEPDGA